MRRGQLMDQCRVAIAEEVRALFDRSPSLAAALAELPFGDGSCFPLVGRGRLHERIDVALSTYNRNLLQQQITRRLCAREWFRQQRPDWCSCELPLDPAEIEAMMEDPDHGTQLVAFFADSLNHVSWNFDGHPSFRRYCCGLISQAPWTDEELRAEYPPRTLRSPRGYPVRFAGKTYVLGD